MDLRDEPQQVTSVVPAEERVKGLDIRDWLVSNERLTPDIEVIILAEAERLKQFLQEQGLRFIDLGWARYVSTPLDPKRPFSDGVIKSFTGSTISCYDIYPAYSLFVPELHAKVLILRYDYDEVSYSIRPVWSYCKGKGFEPIAFNAAVLEGHASMKAGKSLHRGFLEALFGKSKGIKVRPIEDT